MSIIDDWAISFMKGVMGWMEGDYDASMVNVVQSGEKQGTEILGVDTPIVLDESQYSVNDA